MSNFEPVQGLVSEETFDKFRASEWPALFGGQMYHGTKYGMPLDYNVSVLEPSIALRPMEDRDMLAEMGIIEQEPRPERLDEVRDFRFTKMGKEVVAACEGLYTPEEYEARDEEARVHLEQARAERQSQQ